MLLLVRQRIGLRSEWSAKLRIPMKRWLLSMDVPRPLRHGSVTAGLPTTNLQSRPAPRPLKGSTKSLCTNPTATERINLLSSRIDDCHPSPGRLQPGSDEGQRGRSRSDVKQTPLAMQSVPLSTKAKTTRMTVVQLAHASGLRAKRLRCQRSSSDGSRMRCGRCGFEHYSGTRAAWLQEVHAVRQRFLKTSIGI